ncbi:uncharacterized protein LOC129282010 isoform X3 [Lytechinus pictus]|uniref:uncharacterized protein LOC129282010 isoform X3 n=1 Tax=Lytechinus pictus TaxID=7653 RepID=UPI0030B9D91B
MEHLVRYLSVLSVLLACVTLTDAQAACQNNPCNNGAQCQEAILDPGYVCLCSVDWIGRHCDQNAQQYFTLIHSKYEFSPCSRVFFGTSGVITSPNWPSEAGTNEACAYSVRIPTATTITLNLHFFSSEPFKDALYYTAGPDFDILDIDREFNGNNTNQLGIIQLIGVNQVTFVWESDHNILSKGFNISYGIQSDPCFQNLCANGATCQPDGLRYTCDCPIQYSGTYCSQVVVLVQSTLPVLTSGAQVIEGRSLQTVQFNLQLTPSLRSIGNVIGTGLWRVNTFLSGSPTGAGPRLNVVGNVVDLNSEQSSVPWIPTSLTVIGNIRGDFNTNQVSCLQMRYLCATIERGGNPSVDFTIAGDPTDQSLLGCAPLSCVGVEIIFTRLTITSGGTLREGYLSPNIGFDINMSPRASAGSVSGSNLWNVTIFGSANSNGLGPRVGETVVVLNQQQAGADVVLGQDTVLQGINTRWNLNSGVRCAEIPYFCALVEKHNNPSPDFFLSQPPEIACQAITCRGVEVTSTSISLSNGNPIIERDNAHQVTFNLGINTHTEGGRVIGDALWEVRIYYSTSDVINNGLSPTSLVELTEFQAGIDIITPGSPTTLSGVSGTLNLNSALCRNNHFTCAVLSRNPLSNPTFTLSPAPGLDDSVLTSCAPVQCQGVVINNVDFNVQSSQPLQASSSNNLLNFNFLANSLASGASVSGQNLWQLEIFANTLGSGQGTTSLLQTVNLPSGLGDTTLLAGSSLNFNNLQVNFDLTPYACADIPFFCVRLSRNQFSNPEYTLSGSSANSLVSCKSVPCNDRDPCENHQCVNGATCVESGLNYVCTCAPGWTGTNCQTPINLCASNPCANGGTCQNFQTFFTCTCPLGWEGDQCQISDTGVIMQFVRLLINSGVVRQATAFNFLNVDVELNSNPAGDDATGSGLWQVTIYPSTSLNGLGTPPAPGITPFLNFEQSGVDLVSGGQATIEGVSLNLDLANLSCSDFPYLCVRVAKGQNPNPNFLLGGTLIGCSPSNCRGVNITSLDLTLLSGFLPDENSATNPMQFSLSFFSDPSGGSATGTNLWSINTFVSNQPDGSGPRLSLRTNVPLTAIQGSVPAVSGQRRQIQNVGTNADLTNVDCSEFQYFCAELTKGANPSLDFVVVPQSSLSCVNINCNGVTINTIFASISNGFPVTSGQVNPITFDLTATAVPASASINGDNLWQIQVYTTNVNNGDPPSGSSQLLAILPGNQASLDLVGGGTLQFTNIQGQVDLTNVQCTPNTYICFDLQENPAASVPFTLGGQTRFCQLLQCEVNPCFPNNCLNGGMCIPEDDGTFQCVCVNGYTGFLCTIPPDPCNSLPCSNGGTCSRIGQSTYFLCNCPVGYSGATCLSRDRCILESPCLNGATCLPDINLATYQCICQQGFKGVNCQFPDICFPNPCQNQGTCSSDASGQSYTCNCPAGFQGLNCQTVDLCFASPCSNGGTCILQGDTRFCQCLPQYSGDRCQFNNPCLPNPCANGGTCTLDSSGQLPICQCLQSFTGPSCSVPNPCVNNPCQNGGICQPSLSGASYTCDCNDLLWTGLNCNTAVICVVLPCLNGGTCIPSLDGTTFSCQCPVGYGGNLCSISLPCNSNPCSNGGTCFSDGNTFSCACPSGFLGDRCDISNPCQPNPCVNGGVCGVTSQGLQFTCTCPSSRYFGPTCNLQDGCSPENPCQNQGACSATDFLGNYICTCPQGWSGVICQILDPCGVNPCLFGGQCFDDPSRASGFRCVCTSGYTGETCNLIDLCSATPCYNGGTCTLMSGSNDYDCTCLEGYYGDQCHLRHPCNPNPCLNGGVCNSNTNTEPATYTCTCLTDFTGTNCETNELICPIPSQLKCSNGDCVDGQRCNIFVDCPDDSDETSCPFPCQSGMFQCTSILRCISSLLVCDGINHCQDGSDEGQVCKYLSVLFLKYILNEYPNHFQKSSMSCFKLF